MIKAIKIGIDGYIIKPFDYEQLNYELFKIVEKLKKFAENEEYKKHLKRMVEQKTSELNSMIHFQKYNYEKTLLSMVEMIEDRDIHIIAKAINRLTNFLVF
jgi:YesN/AraC family two-component response regulator